MTEVVLLIDGLHELSDDKRHALYSFNLLLRSNQFPLETSSSQSDSCPLRLVPDQVCSPLLILDVFFLKIDISSYKLTDAS